jgi:hypothetical protein
VFFPENGFGPEQLRPSQDISSKRNGFLLHIKFLNSLAATIMDLGPNLCILCDSTSQLSRFGNSTMNSCLRIRLINHPQIIPSQVGGHFVHQTLRLASLNPKKNARNQKSSAWHAKLH